MWPGLLQRLAIPGREEMPKYFRNDHDTTFEQAKVMYMSATIHSLVFYS